MSKIEPCCFLVSKLKAKKVFHFDSQSERLLGADLGIVGLEPASNLVDGGKGTWHMQNGINSNFKIMVIHKNNYELLWEMLNVKLYQHMIFKVEVDEIMENFTSEGLPLKWLKYKNFLEVSVPWHA